MKQLPLAMFCLLVAMPATAGEVGNCYHLASDFDGQVGQEGARAAVKRGDARPFEQILTKVRPVLQGEIVGQKLEQHRGQWLYEFRVVAPDGHMHYVHFDARSGRHVDVKAGPCAS
jgi:uncharacterized membrane protein YkoI